MSQDRILVVSIDDDPNALEILSGICSHAGMEFVGTQDPAEGFELVSSLLPDVVLCDVMMPGTSGFEFCRRLKSIPHLQLIPLVLITSLDDRTDRIRGIEAGCDDFLRKPVDSLELSARIRSLSRIRRITEHLDAAESILSSLALCAEAKDGTTADHCRRLETAGAAFGEWIGLTRAQVLTLGRAGYLHDIGKIAVPDAVLLKPGKLTPEEWDIMKAHTTRGADLLAPLATMAPVLPIVRSHHERWDGNGYPDGLAGDSIPYLARVFQLLDAWDALTSARPYKRAFTHQEAMEVMQRECIEGRWDPGLFERFCEWKRCMPKDSDGDRQSV